MEARLLILILAVLLGGCHTRGALEFDCLRLDTAVEGQPAFRRPLPPSKLQEAIQEGATDLALAAELDWARHAEEEAVRSFAETAALSGPPGGIPEYTALLLSGGGQWGAYGAGFMGRLLERDLFPAPNLVTGVSTGALQALFVGAGLDRPASADRNWAERGVNPNDPPTYADLMRYEYRPSRENQLVYRHSEMGLSILTGSMAGLRPLRGVIENALCADPEGGGECMIDDIATSPTLGIWIGFIDAEDGAFYYVDARQIAADRSLNRRQRRDCITAAALASVAMPGFFQQVRINQHTYYDGGVRQSVFIDHAARHGQRAIRAAHARSLGFLGVAATAPRPAALTPEQVSENLHLYVLRNGPTDLGPEPGADNVTSVIDAAMRAEQIVVNQLEVGSVAALRLEHPVGFLDFRSADGWKRFVYEDALGSLDCEARKGEGVMFDPDFMRCIMAYGRDVGGGTEPWRRLPNIHELARAYAEQE